MANASKKKTKKEIKTTDGKKTLTKNVLRVAVVLIIIAVSVLAVRNSRYFKLESVEVVDASRAAGGLETDSSLQVNMGRNIFDIDITSLASRIESNYPVIKKAVVRRVLPNRLEIDIIPRLPIAKIKDMRGYFPVDETGMVLSPEVKGGRLPVVTGFSMWGRPAVGERLTNKQLENTVRLIKAINETSVARDYGITAIDAPNYKNLSFRLDSGIEVKIGGEDFPGRLRKLKETLAEGDLDKDNIKYLDLRFNGVVIGPK